MSDASEIAEDIGEDIGDLVDESTPAENGNGNHSVDVSISLPEPEPEHIIHEIPSPPVSAPAVIVVEDNRDNEHSHDDWEVWREEHNREHEQLAAHTHEFPISEDRISGLENRLTEIEAHNGESSPDKAEDEETGISTEPTKILPDVPNLEGNGNGNGSDNKKRHWLTRAGF